MEGQSIRRWFRFNLSMLFVLVTVVCVLLASWRVYDQTVLEPLREVEQSDRKFNQIRQGMTKAQVEQLLGTPL